MIYNEFLEHLYQQFQRELPGLSAHALMAPSKRPTAAQAKVSANPKLSAVMVLFYPVDYKPHFCLMQRPTYEGTHSGQVSFPGGKMEPEDDSLKTTALRETFEEVGVEQDKIQVMGELTQVYIPPSNFLVSPFVGFLDERPTFVPDDYEVAEVLEVPVTTLLDDSIIKRGKIPVGSMGIKVNAPYFEIHQKIVWGATAVMLSELREMLRR